jgi:hypothetical protein
MESFTLEERKTRKRKPWVYQSEYDALKSESDKWKKAFQGMTVIAAVQLLVAMMN